MAAMSDRYAPLSDEWVEQLAHQRMKRWMHEHDWSTTTSADPADVFEFIEANGEEADFNDFIQHDCNDSET